MAYKTNNPLEYDDVDGIVIDESAPDSQVASAATNVAILVGRFQRGPANELISINSMAQLNELMGKSNASGNLALKNKAFGRLKVIRAIGATGTAKATLALLDTDDDPSIVINAKYVGSYGNNLQVVVTAGLSGTVTITINDLNLGAAKPQEVYANVVIAGKTQAQLNEIFGSSQLIDVVAPVTAGLNPEILAATSLASGSNGTEADTDYQLALEAAEQERAGNFIFADKQSATIKGYLKAHVQETKDKIAVIGADSDTVNLSAAITDVAAYRDVDGYIVYAYNHLQTRIDGVLVYTSPVSWLVSVMSQIGPNIDPAYIQNVRFTSGVTGIKFGLKRQDYIDAMAAGIAAFEYDGDVAGYKVKSGIVTQILNTSKLTILRRRMTDFYLTSIVSLLKNYQNAPNTKSTRKKIAALITAFDDGLINLGLLPSDDEVTGGKARLIDTESLNTNNTIAAGQLLIAIKRRIYSSARFLVLKAEIGESVVVTEEG